MADEDLLGDPVFQLNLALWTLEELPKSAPIRPIFREHGYHLHSIARPLPLAPSLRAALDSSVKPNDAPSPDVLAEAQGNPFLLIECKKSSFGTESSTAHQATKLIAISSDLTSSLGLSGGARPGIVTYLTPWDQCEALAGTLGEIHSELDGQGLQAPAPATIGILLDGEGVAIRSCESGNLPAALADAIEEPVLVIKSPPDEDPRPLYFIPWDPGVTQSPEEEALCREMLFARVLMEAVQDVGRCSPPDRLVISMQNLLARATFGVSEKWRARHDLQKLERETKLRLGKTLEPLKDRLSIAVPSGPERVELTLHSGDDRDDAVEQLLKPVSQEKAEQAAKEPTLEELDGWSGTGTAREETPPEAPEAQG